MAAADSEAMTRVEATRQAGWWAERAPAVGACVVEVALAAAADLEVVLARAEAAIAGAWAEAGSTAGGMGGGGLSGGGHGWRPPGGVGLISAGHQLLTTRRSGAFSQACD